MCLVGNKVDLDDMKEREVSTETGETFAKVCVLLGLESKTFFFDRSYMYVYRFTVQGSSKQVQKQAIT